MNGFQILYCLITLWLAVGTYEIREPWCAHTVSPILAFFALNPDFSWPTAAEWFSAQQTRPIPLHRCFRRLSCTFYLNYCVCYKYITALLRLHTIFVLQWRLYSILAINKHYLLASLYSREEYQKSFPLLMFRKVYVNSNTPHRFNSLFILFVLFDAMFCDMSTETFNSRNLLCRLRQFSIPVTHVCMSHDKCIHIVHDQNVLCKM